MVDTNYSHILCIVDRSGSMGKLTGEPTYVGGFLSQPTVASTMETALNSFFAEQATLPGKCLVDYVQFDDRFEKVFENRDVHEARATIQPRNMTALLDAMGRGITELGAKLRKLPEVHRPGAVIVAIITDGLENNSRTWTKEKVADLIVQQTEKYDWNITFLGANMDAVAVGRDYGITLDHSLTWDVDNGVNAGASFSNYAANTRNLVAGGASANSVSYSDADREANKPKDLTSSSK